ncbi:MAG: four helix bundle protein [Candidatus Margulisiibacteriota bacterium]
MNRKYDIYDRLLNFGIRIVRFCKILFKNYECRVIADQLVRSGTSVGANMQEADSASSLKDFINKIVIAKKEIQETNYWLKIVKGANLINHEKNTEELAFLLNESEQLTRIIGAILANTKANRT